MTLCECGPCTKMKKDLNEYETEKYTMEIDGIGSSHLDRLNWLNTQIRLYKMLLAQ